MPPESVYVTLTNATGGLVVNQGTTIYADDSTNGSGGARITVRSFSGCGTIRANLYVSGVAQGYKPVTVRTIDPAYSADDYHVTGTDTTGSNPCDINYDGSVNADDNRVVHTLDSGGNGVSHLNHWRRQALFGTLVRRTNLSYVEHGANSYGASQVFWNPSGRWLSFTQHTSAEACNVFLVPSDPLIGNQPKQFTWNADSSDYDPSWSPLNTEIAFGRADYRVVRKGIPGLNADTTETLVAASGSFSVHGDLTPAISPNGQWVAFGRRDQQTGAYNLWKAPISGGQPTQLTFTSGVSDQYPAWSPDGEWIIFDREIGFPNEHHSFKVLANQSQTADSLTTPVYLAPPNTDAATPAYSPDGAIVTIGKGTHTNVLDVRTYSLEPALSSPVPVLNYPDTAFAGKRSVNPGGPRS